MKIVRIILNIFFRKKKRPSLVWLNMLNNQRNGIVGMSVTNRNIAVRGEDHGV